MRFDLSENGIYLTFEKNEEDGTLRFLHFGAEPLCEEAFGGRSTAEGFRLVEVNAAGYDRPLERQGNKYIVTAPGYRLQYAGHSDSRNENGRKLEFTLTDEETGLTVVSHMQFFDGISVVRCWNTVTNTGSEPQTIDTISSFHYTGLEKEGVLPWEEKMELRIPFNAWQQELNWKTFSLPELGLVSSTYDRAKMHSSQRIHISNTGHWSTKQYLPMGYLGNKERSTGLFWQIEHNGSWNWEISDQNGMLYLAVCGPTETDSHWCKTLQPGESFTSVPAAAGVCKGGFDEAMEELTAYRRRIRRKNRDDEQLPIIFNDYMNCLFGDPTTARELPLIDAAAKAGCEYYVIDCGWYSAGPWWNNVGEWQESRERFPNGLREVTDYIRSKGMVPGLWLELEVMGICCEKANRVPDDWFFTRHGKRVFDRSRYQLDFRNPAVIDHANEVIDRLVRDYGVGYIKMDYNIEPGIGTERNADSYGDGLLQHERAYLAWLDDVFARYPELVIENCSSGGLRMDYAMLSRYSIQSTSDQEDYRKYATISANAPSGVTPEQAAVWSYPLRDGSKEEVVFNMVNALLLRIHQSGHLAEISPERLALVKEGLDCYKRIRPDLKDALPFWPLGTASFDDEWLALGLRNGSTVYLAVWRREGGNPFCTLPLKGFAGKNASVRCAYPSFEGCEYQYAPVSGTLNLHLPENNTARLFELHLED